MRNGAPSTPSTNRSSTSRRSCSSPNNSPTNWSPRSPLRGGCAPGSSIIAETEHGERSERAWYRAVGLSSTAIVERVRWQLEGWVAQPGGLSGGITLLRLVPDQVRGDDGDQLGLWGGRSQADHDAPRAVTRLTGLFGEQAVWCRRGAAGGSRPSATSGCRRPPPISTIRRGRLATAAMGRGPVGHLAVAVGRVRRAARRRGRRRTTAARSGSAVGVR